MYLDHLSHAPDPPLYSPQASHRSRWPQTYRDFPAPASQGLGFKAFATMPIPTTPQLALWTSIVPIQESGTQPESIANDVDYISGIGERAVLLLQCLGLSLGFQQGQTQLGDPPEDYLKSFGEMWYLNDYLLRDIGSVLVII